MVTKNSTPVRSLGQQFYDELNYAFPDAQCEIEKDKSIWVYGYPTGFVYDMEQTLEDNLQKAKVKIRNFLIQSV